MKERDLKRFMRYVYKDDNDCWLWVGATFTNGYGRFKINLMSKRAHRLAYEHFVGKIPDGHVIRHSCDIKRCVNPEHLVCGSQEDNVTDSFLHGQRQYNTTPAHMKWKILRKKYTRERRNRSQ